VAPPEHIPHALLQRAERVFKAGATARPQPSRLQQEVSCRLWELGVEHSSQHLTPDGLFCVDIALQGCKVRAGCASAMTANAALTANAENISQRMLPLCIVLQMQRPIEISSKIAKHVLPQSRCCRRLFTEHVQGLLHCLPVSSYLRPSLQPGPCYLAQAVIEVDGPSAFSANQRLPLGQTVARKCMLEAKGYNVRSIPFYQWAALGSAALGSTGMQRAYIVQLLHTIVLQPARSSLQQAV